MTRLPRIFDGCPFCGGRIPTLGWNKRAEPRIYRPHKGLACLCGYADSTAVREGLAARLALARASAAAEREARRPKQ